LALQLAPWETHYRSHLIKIYEKYAGAITNENKDFSLQLLHMAKQLSLENIIINPVNPWIQNRLASVYQRLMALEPDKRADYLPLIEQQIRNAAARDTQNPLFQINLAYFLHKIGKIDEAMTYYQNVIKYDGRILEAYYNLADIYRQKRQWENALVMYLDVYERDPDYSSVGLAIAGIYIQQNQSKEALPYLEAFCDKKTTHYHARKNLAATYYEHQMWLLAAKHYRILYEQNKNETIFHKHYIDTLIKNGSYQQAQVDIDRFLKANPQNKAAKQQRRDVMLHFRSK